jgi:hypothetical protein
LRRVGGSEPGCALALGIKEGDLLKVILDTPRTVAAPTNYEWIEANVTGALAEVFEDLADRNERPMLVVRLQGFGSYTARRGLDTAKMQPWRVPTPAVLITSARLAEAEDLVKNGCEEHPPPNPTASDVGPTPKQQLTDSAVRPSAVELWVSDEATELRVYHSGDASERAQDLLIDECQKIIYNESSLQEALTCVLTGLFGAPPTFQWNRRFTRGPSSAVLAFTLDPKAFATCPLSGCTLRIYPGMAEVDLWDSQGSPLNYLDRPLDSIGVGFASIGEGARRFSSMVGWQRSKACWPVLHMDEDDHRGFPYLQMALI